MAYNSIGQKVPDWYPRVGTSYPEQCQWPEHTVLDSVSVFNQMIDQINYLMGVHYIDNIPSGYVMNRLMFVDYLVPAIQDAREYIGFSDYVFSDPTFEKVFSRQHIFELRDALNINGFFRIKITRDGSVVRPDGFMVVQLWEDVGGSPILTYSSANEGQFVYWSDTDEWVLNYSFVTDWTADKYYWIVLQDYTEIIEGNGFSTKTHKGTGAPLCYQKWNPGGVSWEDTMDVPDDFTCNNYAAYKTDWKFDVRQRVPLVGGFKINIPSLTFDMSGHEIGPTNENGHESSGNSSIEIETGLNVNATCDYYWNISTALVCHYNHMSGTPYKCVLSYGACTHISSNDPSASCWDSCNYWKILGHEEDENGNSTVGIVKEGFEPSGTSFSDTAKMFGEWVGSGFKNSQSCLDESCVPVLGWCKFLNPDWAFADYFLVRWCEWEFIEGFFNASSSAYATCDTIIRSEYGQLAPDER